MSNATSSSSSALSPKHRGAFILLEGLDRAGKTSQCLKLTESLNAAAAAAGADSPIAVNMRFPDRTTATGKMIDEYLRQSKEVDDRAIHLLFSANRWEAVSVMKAALDRGQHIICDRYAFSGIAFSRSKLASAGAALAADDDHALSFEWCCMPDRGLPAPDLVLFMNITAEDAAKRGSFGEERYEKREIQDRVRAVFDDLRAQSTAGSSSNTKAFGQGVQWKVIDAGQSMETVHAELMAAAQQTIERVAKENVPVKLL